MPWWTHSPPTIHDLVELMVASPQKPHPRFYLLACLFIRANPALEGKSLPDLLRAGGYHVKHTEVPHAPHPS